MPQWKTPGAIVIKVCSVASLGLIAYAALGPAKWQLRPMLGWKTEHFLGLLSRHDHPFAGVDDPERLAVRPLACERRHGGGLGRGAFGGKFVLGRCVSSS